MPRSRAPARARPSRPKTAPKRPRAKSRPPAEPRRQEMRMQKQVTAAREIEAKEIPSGMRITIPEGTPLTLTQSLGGSFTVLTPYGYMARVEGKDAEAIGEQPVSLDAEAAAGRSAEDLCWEQLKTCYDPEIPVNIVDLGL